MSSEWIGNIVMVLVMVIIAFGVRHIFLYSSGSRKPDPRDPDPDREASDTNDDPD